MNGSQTESVRGKLYRRFPSLNTVRTWLPPCDVLRTSKLRSLGCTSAKDASAGLAFHWLSVSRSLPDPKSIDGWHRGRDQVCFGRPVSTEVSSRPTQAASSRAG